MLEKTVKVGEVDVKFRSSATIPNYIELNLKEIFSKTSQS